MFVRHVALPIVVAFLLHGAMGCRPYPVPKPGDISFKEFIVPCPRPEVFDDALAFAHASNLVVAVLEKSSGLIKFEQANLTVTDLDAFCEFPLRDAKTGAPFSTFWEWNQWWGERIGDSKVFLNVLMSEKGSKQTSINIRGNWSAVLSNDAYTGVTRAYTLDSTGVLEGMLRKHLLDACDGRSSPGAIEMLREFSLEYEALRAQYNEGKMKTKEYEAQRDQLLLDFRNGMNGNDTK